MKKLTVFTPTFNRAHTLHKLYDSLKQQSNKDFEWLIVDDGSSDQTKNLVQKWQNEGEVAISYHYQNNSGKMVAHNKGVSLCKTELFVCIDSDDYLVADAVEKILNTWNAISNNSKIAGIVAYRTYVQDDGNTSIKCHFPYLGNSKIYLLYQNGFVGDTTIVIRTEILSKFPFPYFEGEKFVSEATVYNQIDTLYDWQLMNEAITVCKYLDDGYTKNCNQLFNRNPKGMAYYYNARTKLPLLSLKNKIKSIAYYIVYANRAEYGSCKIYSISNKKGILFVLGFILSLRYRKRI